MEILNAFAEFLLKGFKGAISFLQEFIPIFSKALFLLSPFILSIIAAYVIGGNILLIAAILFLGIFILGGTAWARKKNLEGSKLTFGVVVCVLLLDALACSVLVYKLAPKFFGQANVVTTQNTISSEVDVQGDGQLKGDSNQQQSTYSVATPSPTAMPPDYNPETVRNFKFKLLFCTSHSIVFCKIDVQNLASTNRWFALNAEKSRFAPSVLQDEDGNKYKASRQIYEDKEKQTGVLLKPQETIRMVIVFPVENISKISLLTLSCNEATDGEKIWGDVWFVQFRDIIATRD